MMFLYGAAITIVILVLFLLIGYAAWLVDNKTTDLGPLYFCVTVVFVLVLVILIHYALNESNKNVKPEAEPIPMKDVKS